MKSLYKEGDKLGNDEYVLKIRDDKTGFIARLTKKGELPKLFVDWGGSWNRPSILPIYIHREVFNSGWKLRNWRFGESQNWAKLIHPEGFTIEIYLSQFLEIVQQNEIKFGEIIGSFKWQDNRLIKEV